MKTDKIVLIIQVVFAIIVIMLLIHVGLWLADQLAPYANTGVR